MPTDTMRAVRYHSYGSPEVLVVEEVPRPEPGGGEVLVRVHAAGVNPIDWKMRKGLISRPLPAIPGGDLAGVVEAVGRGVASFRQGQEVYGAGRGTYAEYAVSPADGLAPKPKNLTFDQAAAVPIGVRAAWMSIFEAGGLQPGQRLMVHGAAGGVGLFAVQLGRWKGAHVVGAASAANQELVRSLGAEMVVDYASTPFESVISDVDVVLDTIGGETQGRSWQTLKPGGILVTIVGPAPIEKAKQFGRRGASVARPASDADLFRQVAELIEAGAVVPIVQKVLPLEEARQAQELSESGHGRGRIVLHVAD